MYWNPAHIHTHVIITVFFSLFLFRHPQNCWAAQQTAEEASAKTLEYFGELERKRQEIEGLYKEVETMRENKLDYLPGSLLMSPHVF